MNTVGTVAQVVAVFLGIALPFSAAAALFAHLFMKFKASYDEALTPGDARTAVRHAFWGAFVLSALFAAGLACSALPGRASFIGVVGVFVLGGCLEAIVVGSYMGKFEMSFNKQMTPRMAKSATRFLAGYVLVIGLVMATVFAILTDFGTK